MYTIGQVAKFLGISRDTLKFYEEKELVKPNQDEVNGYRKYSHFDIYDVITTNFYRELDIEIKKIKEIRKSKSIENIKLLFEEKEQQILDEIEYKNLILKRIKFVKEDCKKIKQYLGEYNIKEMKPLEVRGEITNITSFDEYDIIQNNTNNIKKAVTLNGLRRIISFDKESIIGDKFIVVKKVEDFNENIEGEVIYHPKCIYTIIEDGRYLNNGESIDNKVEEHVRKVAIENGYELVGLAYVNILLTTYEEELERIFLEIYVPIK